MDDLLTEVEATLEAEMCALDVLIPFERGELVSLFHERGLIDDESHNAEGTRIQGLMPDDFAVQFEPFEVEPQEQEDVR
jgi:GTP-binding protein HflX